TDLRQDYTFVHPDPLSGINLYRLRQVDTDGTENRSSIVSIRFNSTPTGDLEVWPTPADKQLNMRTTHTDFTVELFDTAGRRVYKGENRHILPTGRLPAGTYQLLLRSPAGVLLGSQRVMVAPH
ncbi:MAG: T9SS type A sorting domain-containing protein, partial [Saprospiraceae bacterium]